MTAVTLDTLTDAERAETDKWIVVAGRHGWQQVDRAEKNGKLYAPGVRVRHGGQQYWQALQYGAGIIVAVLARNDEIELIVAYDEPRISGLSRITQLGDYHVDLGPFEQVA